VGNPFAPKDTAAQQKHDTEQMALKWAQCMRDHGVNITVKDANGGSYTWLINLLPFVLLGALWFIMIRQMQTGGNKALSFGKSRARLLSMQQKKVTFKDVAGVDEAKEELKEIIEFLREAHDIYRRLGDRRGLAVTLNNLGVALLEQYRFADAVAAFKKARELDPDLKMVQINLAVGLYYLPDLTAARRDDPCGHRPAEAERIADGNHPVADPRIAVSEGHEWKTAGAIDLDQGNIGVLIRADHLCGKNTAVIGRNLDLVGRFDDMEVGHRVAVSRNEKAGALTGEDVAAAGG